MDRELHIIGFRVGRETYGVPITAVHEIVRVPEVTAVPDSPDYIEGVINLRGRIVSIIDLRKRFREAAPAGGKNRILVAESHGKLVGLIVDSASEVLKIPAQEVEPAPALLQEGTLNCVTGVGKLPGRLIILLDLERLLDRTADTAEPSAARAAAAALPADHAGAARAHTGGRG
jgi:purine-binding chemotaxis protein CheW